MSKALNVLVDTSPLGNANAIRGVGVYTRLLVEHLRKKSQVNVFTSADKPSLKEIDVVHYPYFDLFFPTLPFFKPKPTVVTIHDTIPLQFPKQYQPGFKGFLKLKRQQWSLQSVKAVITDSVSSKNDIVEKLKVSEENVNSVYLAANPEIKAQSQKTVSKVLASFDIPEHYILYVGDINYNKNIPQLIKSLKFLPEEVHLVCVGKNFKPADIPEWQWIETQIAMSDVTTRVHFVTDLGSDALTDLSALYSGAQAYVQPSLYEGFGLPVLEAMQAKTPVVSTNNSSLSEVGGEHAVYTTSTQAEDIAAAVEQVLGWSKTKRAQKIKAAHTWSQGFSWDKTAAETIKIYQKVVAR